MENEGWPAAEKQLAAAMKDEPDAALVNPAALNSVGYDLLGSLCTCASWRLSYQLLLSF